MSNELNETRLKELRAIAQKAHPLADGRCRCKGCTEYRENFRAGTGLELVEMAIRLTEGQERRPETATPPD